MSNDYQFWFTQNKEVVKLPVNPESMSISNGSQNDTFRVEGLGDITILQSPEPAEISFSFELPAAYYPGCNFNPIIDPMVTYMSLILMKEGGPVQFILTGKYMSMAMSIEELSFTESGGDIGTLDVSIKMKQYNKAQAKQLVVSSNNKVKLPPAQSARPAPHPVQVPQSITHKVVKGDTMYIIARKYLGNGARWPEIYKLNKAKVKDPQRIDPGLVLQIPKK